MQISRLFEIVYMLMRREKMSAKELAAHFEVSTRTIYRDLDVLSGAGIPIYATKGRGGGIQLLPDFVLNRSWFSQSEQSDILAAMQSLAAANVPDIDSALHKLGALFQQDTPQWVAIDFSDWSAHSRDKFELLKTAILQQRAISFTYYNSSNQRTLRRAEPCQLWFKHRAWYLRAFCLQKSAPRLFKLTRMREVVMTDADCHHPLSLQCFEAPAATPPTPVHIVLVLSPAAAYRVYDEFEEEQVQPLPDGSFRVEMDFVEDDWSYGYLLSFAAQGYVLEPAHLRRRLQEKLRAMLELYL